MAFVTHLNKSGKGWSSKTACGRNLLRTPISTDWEGFKTTDARYQCAKCSASRQAELNERRDLDAWEPVDDANAWMAADAALIAAHRARKAARQQVAA